VFAPDGRTLALGGPKRPGIQVWDLSGGQLKLRAVLGVGDSAGLGFSPDGRALASLRLVWGTHPQMFVDWWDVDQRAIKSQVVLEPQKLSGISVFVPLPPGARAVTWLEGAISAPPAGRARIWSTLTGEYRECKPSFGRRRFRSDKVPASHSPAFAPDGRHMAVSWGDGTVHIVRLPAGEGRGALSWCDRALRQNPRDVEALLQRAWLALGGDRPGHPGPHPGSLVRCLCGHPKEGTGAAFLPGRRVATAAPDGTLTVWGLETVLPLRTLRGNPLNATNAKALPLAVASRDGCRLLVADGPRLHLWDLNSGKEVGPLDAHPEPIVEALFSADGRLALSASGDGTVHLRAAASGKQRGAFRVPGGPITCVALAPGGRLAACGGADGTVRLWNAGTGEDVRVLKGHKGTVRRLAFVGDDRLLSAGADGTFRLWDAASGRQLRSSGGPRKPVVTAALASGGLALCRSADELAVYDTATGERLRVLQARSSSDSCAGSEHLAVSADGLLALAAGAKGVQVWRMPPTLDQVEADLEAALGVEKSARAHYLRGLLRARRQARAGAIADFTEAIRLDPKHARAYHARGILLAEQEDYARAREDLDRAFDLEPALANVGRR
jgi:WD40 repeat protein